MLNCYSDRHVLIRSQGRVAKADEIIRQVKLPHTAAKLEKHDRKNDPERAPQTRRQEQDGVWIKTNKYVSSLSIDTQIQFLAAIASTASSPSLPQRQQHLILPIRVRLGDNFRLPHSHPLAGSAGKGQELSGSAHARVPNVTQAKFFTQQGFHDLCAFMPFKFRVRKNIAFKH